MLQILRNYCTKSSERERLPFQTRNPTQLPWGWDHSGRCPGDSRTPTHQPIGSCRGLEDGVSKTPTKGGRQWYGQSAMKAIGTWLVLSSGLCPAARSADPGRQTWGALMIRCIVLVLAVGTCGLALAGGTTK